MLAEPQCSTCNCAMEPGFVPTSKGGASLYAAGWHPGEADSNKGFWDKVRTGGGGVKVDADRLIPIVAYRCPQCGLIQLYGRAG